MQQAYTGSDNLEAFAAAQEQFQALVAPLGSEASAGLGHGEIERLIEIEGTERLRRLLARASGRSSPGGAGAGGGGGRRWNRP